MKHELKVLTINTHKGFSYFNRRFILHELREAIRATQADLVFMQEVLGEHNRWAKAHSDKWPEQPQYEFLADSIWSEFAYGRNAVYDDGHHGNALLSKYPIESWRNIDISLNGIEKRGLLHATVRLGDTGKRVHAVSTHLSLREPHRQIQLDRLCDLVNSLPDDEPVIVAGDFNDWRLKAQNKLRTKAGLNDVFTLAHGRPARTFPAILPILRLDRIYVRKAHSHSPVVVPNHPWKHLSDHKPLFARVGVH